MKRYILFFAMVISIPVFLGVNAWQSNKCGELKNSIREIERNQENSVDENRTVAAEIADLLAVDKIEDEAQKKLEMQKIRPQDVTLIIMGGKGRDF